MNAIELVSAFANQTAADGRASGLHFVGRVAYSYGEHFPLAVIDHDRKVALINTDKYSRTTSKHQSLIHSALQRAGYETTGATTMKMQLAAAKSSAQASAHKVPVGQRYHRSDAWRGYVIPANAIACANDTGTHSDSPCPSDVSEREINDLRAHLKAMKINTTIRFGETSNVFCGKRWLCVTRIANFAKAASATMTYLAEHDGDTRLLHSAELEELGYTA